MLCIILRLGLLCLILAHILSAANNAPVGSSHRFPGAHPAALQPLPVLPNPPYAPSQAGPAQIAGGGSGPTSSMHEDPKVSAAIQSHGYSGTCKDPLLITQLDKSPDYMTWYACAGLSGHREFSRASFEVLDSHHGHLYCLLVSADLKQLHSNTGLAVQPENLGKCFSPNPDPNFQVHGNFPVSRILDRKTTQKYRMIHQGAEGNALLNRLLLDPLDTVHQVQKYYKTDRMTSSQLQAFLRPLGMGGSVVSLSTRPSLEDTVPVVRWIFERPVPTVTDTREVTEQVSAIVDALQKQKTEKDTQGWGLNLNKVTQDMAQTRNSDYSHLCFVDRSFIISAFEASWKVKSNNWNIGNKVPDQIPREVALRYLLARKQIQNEQISKSSQSTRARDRSVTLKPTNEELKNNLEKYFVTDHASDSEFKLTWETSGEPLLPTPQGKKRGRHV